MDCQPHAAVEHCGRETAMHGTSRIQVGAVWHCCDHDATARGLAHVIAQSFGHSIQWQCPIGEPLNEFQATHRLLPFGTDGSIHFASGAAWHYLDLPGMSQINDTRYKRATRFLKAVNVFQFAATID